MTFGASFRSCSCSPSPGRSPRAGPRRSASGPCARTSALRPFAVGFVIVFALLNFLSLRCSAAGLVAHVPLVLAHGPGWHPTQSVWAWPRSSRSHHREASTLRLSNRCAEEPGTRCEQGPSQYSSLGVPDATLSRPIPRLPLTTRLSACPVMTDFDGSHSLRAATAHAAPARGTHACARRGGRSHCLDAPRGAAHQ